MSSRVSNKDVHLGEHKKQKPFLKFNDLQVLHAKRPLHCKLLLNAVLGYLSRLNPRVDMAQNKNIVPGCFTKDEIFSKTFERADHDRLHGYDVLTSQFKPRSSSNDV
ncbi:hypothetical protein Tco_1001100 [Tanacetum coccineum]